MTIKKLLMCGIIELLIEKGESIMVNFESIEETIVEWFADYWGLYGEKGVAKLYGQILLDAEKGLDCYLHDNINEAE